MNRTVLKTIATLMVFAFFLFLGFASGDPEPPKPKRNTSYNLEEACGNLKNRCLNMFRKKLPEMVRILREMDRNQSDDAQSLMSTLEGIVILQDLQELEQNLEKYCPSEHESYKAQVGLMLLFELGKSNN